MSFETPPGKPIELETNRLGRTLGRHVWELKLHAMQAEQTEGVFTATYEKLDPAYGVNALSIGVRGLSRRQQLLQRAKPMSWDHTSLHLSTPDSSMSLRVSARSFWGRTNWNLGRIWGYQLGQESSEPIRDIDVLKSAIDNIYGFRADDYISVATKKEALMLEPVYDLRGEHATPFHQAALTLMGPNAPRRPHPHIPGHYRFDLVSRPGANYMAANFMSYDGSYHGNIIVRPDKEQYPALQPRRVRFLYNATDDLGAIVSFYPVSEHDEFSPLSPEARTQLLQFLAENAQPELLVDNPE